MKRLSRYGSIKKITASIMDLGPSTKGQSTKDTRGMPSMLRLSSFDNNTYLTTRRHMILDNIFTILNVDSDNMSFDLDELESNTVKQNKILELMANSEGYFYFEQSQNKDAKAYMNFITCVIKQMGFDMICVYSIDTNNESASCIPKRIVKIIDT